MSSSYIKMMLLTLIVLIFSSLFIIGIKSQEDDEGKQQQQFQSAPSPSQPQQNITTQYQAPPIFQQMYQPRFQISRRAIPRFIQQSQQPQQSMQQQFQMEQQPQQMEREQIQVRFPDEKAIKKTDDETDMSIIMKIVKPDEIRLFKQDQPLWFTPFDISRKLTKSWLLGKEEAIIGISKNATKGKLDYDEIQEKNQKNEFLIKSDDLKQHIQYSYQLGSLYELSLLILAQNPDLPSARIGSMQQMQEFKTLAIEKMNNINKNENSSEDMETNTILFGYPVGFTYPFFPFHGGFGYPKFGFKKYWL